MADPSAQGTPIRPHADAHPAGQPTGQIAPAWQGINRIVILCLLQTEQGVASGPLHDRLCAAARALVADGAPVPVTIAAVGDPQVMRPDSLSILVHASIGDGVGAVSVRPWRNDPAALMLFTAAPRAVRLGSDPIDSLAPALRAAIHETLPWAVGAPGGPMTG